MFECPSFSHRGRPAVGLAFLLVLSACRSFTEPDEGPDGVEPPEGAPSFEAQLSSQLPASMALPLVSVAAGGTHTCAASANGAVYCWGRNQGGLGADIPSDASVHVAVRIDGGANIWIGGENADNTDGNIKPAIATGLGFTL